MKIDTLLQHAARCLMIRCNWHWSWSWWALLEATTSTCYITSIEWLIMRRTILRWHIISGHIYIWIVAAYASATHRTIAITSHSIAGTSTWRRSGRLIIRYCVCWHISCWRRLHGCCFRRRLLLLCDCNGRTGFCWVFGGWWRLLRLNWQLLILILWRLLIIIYVWHRSSALSWTSAWHAASVCRTYIYRNYIDAIRLSQIDRTYLNPIPRGGIPLNIPRPRIFGDPLKFRGGPPIGPIRGIPRPL